MSDTTNDRPADAGAGLEADEISDEQEPATESADAEGQGVYEAQNFGEPNSSQSGG